MSVESKVNDFVAGLRDEESRLKEQLVEAEKRVREVKSEIARVQKGLRGLSARNGAGKKSKKKTGENRPAAESAPQHHEAEQHHEQHAVQ